MCIINIYATIEIESSFEDVIPGRENRLAVPAFSQK